VWFVTEEQKVGNSNVNQYSYSDVGLSEIAIYKNGIPLYQNEWTKSLKIERNSPDLLYFYEAYLKCFGQTAFDISVERFQHDLFILCYNLSVNPIVADEKMIERNIDERVLPVLDAGSLDVSIVLKQALTVPYLAMFCSVSDLCVRFDQNGLFVES
jgi:hypothetical protein